MTPGPWTVFGSAAFRKLWVALTLSLFGDLFSYIAMAWLVLQLTGSSLALGTVLLVQAVPRALLMLVGGALVDRLSARLAMLASMGARVLVVGSLAGLVLAGQIQLWEVYIAAAVFGIVDAFFMPAQRSILPRIVADEQLEAGNAVVNVTNQAAVILGPALAGVVVAVFGTGWAFATDAACFAIGFLFILWLPRLDRVAETGSPGLGGQIKAGLRYAWADVGIRSALFIIAAIDFAAGGALDVGLPTLAHGRFGAGAAGFGILLGSWGVGATAGALAGGMIKRPERMGWWLVGVCAWLGVCIGAVGVIPFLVPAAIAIGIAGISAGAVNTFGVSWLQRRTEPAMQGRVMSLVMLASMGLVPISFALAGFIAEVNPTALFLAAGGLMVATAVAAGASRTVRSI
ncbi:MAG: MFS transporter [Candidatus Dormiibacterota bacterium]